MNIIDWTQDRIDLIKRTICPKGISNDELALFIEQCKRSDLDPLLKQAFCVPRRVNIGDRDKPNWVNKHEFQPSEAGMLARAERFTNYRGIMGAAVFEGDEILVDEGAGEVRHQYNPAKRQGKLVGAWARVRREGKDPVVRWVDFSTRVQSTPLWGKDGAGMVLKCAKVAALRTAYPEAFGGMYIPGERPDDVDPGDDFETTAAPIERPALTAPATRETLEYTPQQEKVAVTREWTATDAAHEIATLPHDPGGDDDDGDAVENASLSIVHACEQVGDMAAYRDLAKRGMALPKGSDAAKRATNALRRAHARLTVTGAPT